MPLATGLATEFLERARVTDSLVDGLLGRFWNCLDRVDVGWGAESIGRILRIAAGRRSSRA